MRKLATILLIAALSFLSMIIFSPKVKAQEWETTSTSATPSADRVLCSTKDSAGNPTELNDFAVNVSNITFNVDTGTFQYNVNVAWSRCNFKGDLSRAFAIYGPISICPISGWYGLNGTATDCVKYVGNPAYSPPSDLKCSEGRTNAQCTTADFNAAIIAEQDPSLLDIKNKRRYAQTFIIPNWTNVRNSSTSYSIIEQMCQYYKSVVFLTPIDVTGSRCENITITANWKKLPPPIQTSFDDVCNTKNAAQPDAFFRERGFASKDDASTKAWGWAYDGSVGSTNSTVRIYYNKDVPNKAQAFEDVRANSKRVDVNRARGIPEGVGFKVEVPLRFFDGNQHTASAFLLKNNTEIPLNGSPITFTCPKYFAPFLQTTQGNVISAGKISGQIRGLPGSMDPSLSEAEFLVVSLVGGGSPFCSQYKYVIGNPNSQDSNINERCKNGKYNASVPNIGSGDKFAIYEVLSSVYSNQAVNQSECQNPDNKQIGKAEANKLPDKDGTVVKLGTNCEEGLIYKIEGNLQIDRTVLTGGRVTIIVKGDVTIADQITADTTPRSNPKLVPSLAIVSTGNINIKPIGGGDLVDMNVLANLYSGGKIRTCAENSKLLDVNQCRQRLFIFGSVVSSLQSDFNRTFFQEASADQQPTELIKFNPLYTSAGIEDRWFRESSSNNSSFKVEDEIEELPPEF